MTTFDERERAFENKFVHDQEVEFKVNARANKLFGNWAAKQMGLPSAEAVDYAMETVQADLAQPGSADVIDKIMHDLRRKGIRLTMEELNEEYERHYLEAARQIRTE